MNKIMVTKSSLPDMQEYFDEIRTIWDTCWLTNMGEKHNLLEKMLRDYLQSPEISLFSNGHMALELALQAMNLEGEVITTPFTFASTTHAIVRNGLQPVFCDINKDDYTIDVSKIEELITEKTSAILPVHVYGNICDVEKIGEIAKKHSLKVIYDAAHAFGITYKNQNVSCFGDASMFSFHATKVFNTIEGGAICHNNARFGERLYQLKNFGIKDAEQVIAVGANAKMNEFQAAMGICNLRHFEEEVRKRKRVYERYIENLKEIKGIRLPGIKDDVESNYSYFPVLFDKHVYGKSRDEVYEELMNHNIFSRKYFYPIISEYECYKDKFHSENTPVALDISSKVLTLPIYANLTLEEVDCICDILKGK